MTDKTQELVERIDSRVRQIINELSLEFDEYLFSEKHLLEQCKAQLTAQDNGIKSLREGLEIANRCIDNGDLILKGSAYDTIIKQVLNEKI